MQRSQPKRLVGLTQHATSRTRREKNAHLVVNPGQFLSVGALQGCQYAIEPGECFRRQHHNGKGLTRQGVSCRTALQDSQPDRPATLKLAQATHQKLDGVATPFVDVHARVPAAQPANVDSHALPGLRRGFCFTLPMHIHIDTAGAT